MLFTEVLIEGTDQNIIFHSGGAHQQQTIHGRHHSGCQRCQHQTAQDRRQQTVDHHKYGLIRGGQIGEQNLAAQADDDDADFDNTDDTHNHGKAAFLLFRALQGVEALDVVRGAQCTKEVVHQYSDKGCGCKRAAGGGPADGTNGIGGGVGFAQIAAYCDESSDDQRSDAEQH